MKEEIQPVQSQKKNKKGNGKGIPRKALKNLINTELEKQSKEAFYSLLKSEDLPPADQTEEESQVIHENVACDGCGMAPIVGIRYKCSVRKNFDYCAGCEERLPHEYAMLAIKKPGGAPDVMITMLPEDAPMEEETKDSPEDFMNQMM